MKTRLLLAEDNPADARLVRVMLQDAAGGMFELEETKRVSEAIQQLKTGRYDELLLDLGLPDSQGMETLARAQQVCGNVPIVVLTGQDDPSFAVAAVAAGAEDYLVKGRFNGELLVRTIRYAIERKRAHERIRQLAAIVDASHESMLSTTLSGTVLTWNAGAERLFGYSAEEMIGQSMARLVPPEREEHFRHMQDEIRRGAMVETETVRRRKDGTLVDVLVAVSPIRNGDGDVVGAAAVSTDISERKRFERVLADSNAELKRYKAQLENANAELQQQIAARDRTQKELESLAAALEQRVRERTAELRESETRFKVIAASTPDHLVVQDRDLRYTLVVNPQLGLTADEMLGKTDSEVLSAEAARELTAIKRRVLETGQRCPVDVAVRSRTGTLEYFEGSYVPKIGPHGQVDGVIGYIRNVTERKRAEAELRESKQRVELGLHVGRAFAFEWIVSTDEVRRSGHCGEILGLAGEAATRDTGRNFIQRIHPDDRGSFSAILNRLSVSNPQYATQYRYVRPDGAAIYIQESGVGTFGTDGKLARLIGMSADVTARVTAENAVVQLNHELKQRMVELQTILDTAPIGLAISDDTEGRRIRGNPAVERMLGLNPGAELSLTAFDPPSFRVMATDRDIPANMLPVQRACRGEHVRGDIVEIVKSDGQVVTLYSSAAPLIDDSGRPRGAVAAFLDITKSKQAEEALRRSERRFRTIYDTAPVSIWQEDWTPVIALIARLRERGVTDLRAHLSEHPELVAQIVREIRVLDVNQWTLAMVGATDKAELVGSIGTVFAGPEAQAGIAGALVAVAEGRSTYSAEMPLDTVRGERIYGLVTIAFPASDHDFSTVLVSMIDISQRKKAELALEAVAAELKETNHELESFSYSVSHDLRAPLRSIDGFSRIVLRDAEHLTPESRENLERVRQAAHHLSRLIDDLLALSRTTRAPLTRSRVSLSELAALVVGTLEADEPGRKVAVNIAPNLLASADPVLMRSVLENLIGNAWKFTRHEPCPRIEIGRTLLDGRDAFYVRDNGVGFDMAYVGKLFGPFQRLHSSADFPGTGIGLATVQRIVRRHGGTVWAESAAGQGATFYFTLPVSEPMP